MKNILTLLFVITFNHSFTQTDTVIYKTIVDPSAMVAGSSGGKIQAVKFKAARKIELAGVSADSAIVISYLFYATGKGFESGPRYIQAVKGNLFTKEVIKILDKAKPGTTIVIDEIKVAYRNKNKWIPSDTFTLY